MDEQLLLIKKQIREWIKLDYIVPEDIPEIELYMEQVTRFMDARLGSNRRNPDDKILTKMMINNYTKNKLMPPPEKKKYNKEHIYFLIYIYYLKNVISIGDIQKLLDPMLGYYQEGDKLTEIYKEIYEAEKSQYFNIESSTAKAKAITDKRFPEEKDEYLNKMAFIYMLGYDIFSKKRLIEKMIDELPDFEEDEKGQKNPKNQKEGKDKKDKKDPKDKKAKTKIETNK